MSQWWRRRESNPRPRTHCHRLYMLSLLFGFNRHYPERQEERERARFVFNTCALGRHWCDLV